MKIAIPLFIDRISPRFDFAPTLGLFNIEGEKIMDSREISCEGWNENERILQLKELGVDTLICGGLPNYLMGLLNHNGIKVIPWVAGNANEALALFLQGRLDSGMTLCAGRGRRHRACTRKKGVV
ncbi:MAG TPA: NifB/NifX family molybdenum-iron cluster-binding protein [Thermodesulfobacteriota bacterium]|jgi:predicted Fe-Mo cluster-binding NifX family protein|nr:NifB/NifX family molybdenum-iron cluster-binding protein [Thermodesulfobacteriota bacterium]